MLFEIGLKYSAQTILLIIVNSGELLQTIPILMK